MLVRRWRFMVFLSAGFWPASGFAGVIPGAILEKIFHRREELLNLTFAV
jgi:hypothetical protein